MKCKSWALFNFSKSQNFLSQEVEAQLVIIFVQDLWICVTLCVCMLSVHVVLKFRLTGSWMSADLYFNLILPICRRMLSWSSSTLARTSTACRPPSWAWCSMCRRLISTADSSWSAPQRLAEFIGRASRKRFQWLPKINRQCWEIYSAQKLKRVIKVSCKTIDTRFTFKALSCQRFLQKIELALCRRTCFEFFFSGSWGRKLIS